MAVVDKISQLVKHQFPSFYAEEGERFIAFVEAYYAYMEQTGKMTDAIKNLESYRDISTTTDEFIKYFINSFLPSVPLDVAADKKLMVKYINNFNISRGTLSSYKLLFRALYNEELEVKYPAEQILKVSDGDWRKERYIVSNYDENSYRFIGKTIIGTSSRAQALVEDIVRKVVKGRDIMQIILSNIKGTFNDLEPIKLFTDVSATPHAPIMEAGIARVDILSPGGEYRQGDVVNLISGENGDFAKAVVIATEDLLGSLSFSLLDGGSGYTGSTDDGGTTIEFIGGDGTEPASFVIRRNDLVDNFAIAININLLSSNTIFGEKAPTITSASGSPIKLSQFANMVLSCPDYGFQELSEEVTSGIDFRDQRSALIQINNTAPIAEGTSIYGASSGANGVILEVISGGSGSAIFRIDGYKKFTGSETVRITTPSGLSVGTVISFSSNTTGTHVLEIANLAGELIAQGDEVVGLVSNSFGVVKKILSNAANGYTANTGGGDDRNLVTVVVSSNSTSNLTSQFDTGPLKGFVENEGLRRVGSSVVIGNTTNSSSNTEIEGLYTRLTDALIFEATTFGTIARLSLPVGGSGFTVAPTIRVRENSIASLGVGEAYITLQSDDENWGTGNSSFTKLDTNDRIFQSSTGAIADVKGGARPLQPIAVSQFANGTYQMIVRTWQMINQRSPGNVQFANNDNVILQLYNDSYVFGEDDSRSVVGAGSAKIVGIQDEGILGDNARVRASVGANGSITSIRVIDSGFCYKDNEIVILETPARNLGVSASLRLTMSGAANSEGYYATTRSHVSSKRGFIQDSRYYQEYSYEIISPIPLDKYRDVVLNLVHPAGQALFARYRTQSNVAVDVVVSSTRLTKVKATGTVSISNGSFTVTGSSTTFLSQFANGDNMVIEYAKNQYYKIPINKVTNNTTANLTIAWANTNLSGANAYYFE